MCRTTFLSPAPTVTACSCVPRVGWRNTIRCSPGRSSIGAARGVRNGARTSAVAPGTVKARILVCHGADDPLIEPEQIQKFQRVFTEAEADWLFISYGGAKHSFTNKGADGRGIPALAYSAGTGLNLGQYWPGTFSVQYQSKSPTVAFAAKIALEEIDRIRAEKVTEEEMAVAKGSFVEAFPRRFESAARSVRASSA